MRLYVKEIKGCILCPAFLETREEDVVGYCMRKIKPVLSCEAYDESKSIDLHHKFPSWCPLEVI